ncbi:MULTISPECIES: threonine/serine exporter ThrE family protein [unclassified Gemella]|uniref:threonine/serine ThrE exporter family protein n=1 Tax=unclassified Gemella TaxID=2624949 RepID=UPI0010739F7B|nr:MULTISPECIES: threonine/serine exporter family protein [unclassified Gemella]MBF0710290.1 threonine/serine exporter family protein [Gemella sp. GL1.1]MBF0746966.1 threonine/serine exporter family protein [Gemella sp. 19428wG2_WT2a]NYS27634.1 threonine/serine exporter family protein [Gemella sp. GL1]TFU58785.1 threonine/serine exporter [Gemella sp. WT2a]
MLLENEKDAKALLNFSVKMARMMMSYGAEVYRVEDTVYRVLVSHRNIDTVNVLVTYSFVIITFIYEDSNMTAMRRISAADNDLEKISLINDLSRQMVSGQIEDIHSAFEKLNEIKAMKPYGDWVKIAALTISAPFFALMFYGTFKDSLFSFAIMAIEAYFLIYATKLKVLDHLSNFIGAFIATVLPSLAAQYFFIENPASITIVGLIPLVPGVQITNSVRDFMAGDYMSGMIGTLSAVFVGTTIALGVLLGLRLV